MLWKVRVTHVRYDIGFDLNNNKICMYFLSKTEKRLLVAMYGMLQAVVSILLISSILCIFPRVGCTGCSNVLSHSGSNNKRELGKKAYT